ncbi:MAG: sodium-dependent transporter [Actinomycetota bacterium]
MGGDRDDTTVLSAIGDAALYPRSVWRSESAYVLATVAGVVGLGNIWRFPYMAGRHGGGSFLVAYVVCVLLVAVPLASVEGAAGSLRRRSPVGVFRRSAGRWGGIIGWLVIGMTVAILSYYVVVTGWTLGYLLDAVTGQLSTFNEFTEGYRSLWLMLAVGALLFLVLIRGVATVERASLYLVPLLVVIVIALAAYGLTLEGAAEARDFYFGVDTDSLLRPDTWQAAAGQAFYSLGIGQGILIAYGSFVPAGANLLRSTSVIAVTNSIVSVISGLMVFAVVFTFGIEPTAGSELSFTAFPPVFSQLAGGAILAVAFFGLLFLAGFTSCIGATVVAVSTVRDEFSIGKRLGTFVTVTTVMLLGVPSALSFTDVRLSIGGQPVLDRIDQFTGAGAIVVLGLLGAAVLARTLPNRTLVAAFNADPLRFGRRLAPVPRAIVWWVGVLPVVAAALYVLGSIL